MAKLKIGGTWAGVIEVVLEDWTVPMLRIEVAKRSNCSPESINLICAGKVLRDGDGTERSWSNWASRTTLGFSPVGAASRRESPWMRSCWPRRNALGDSAESRQLP